LAGITWPWQISILKLQPPRTYYDANKRIKKLTEKPFEPEDIREDGWELTG
jgi:hypothetical protein